MDNTKALELSEAGSKEVAATRRFMRLLDNNANTDVATFDSMLAETGNRDQAFSDLPQAAQRILSHPSIEADKQIVFDGIADGIAEYQHRNGGELPAAHVISAALTSAAGMIDVFERKQSTGDSAFDSLSFSHHEALSVVPAAVQVTIASGIANALPLVTMLPNPTGSNELPIVFGTAVADSNMGVMRRGDLLDGDKAGMPYLENRHTLVMEKGVSGAFSLESHVAYTKQVRSNGTVKFVVDKSSPKAPFLGGRVAVMVKGIEIANDKHRDHPTTKGTSTLQPLGEIQIGTEKFKVTTATASLDTHEVNVQFDVSGGFTEPAADDVTVEIIFDFERRDSNGNFILRAPGTDMEFLNRSIFAFPSRARSVATIDAITQLQNELNISWYAAAQMIMIQRYYFEQNGRLLRTAVNMALSSQDPKHGRVIQFDFNTNGVSPTNIADAVSKINLTLGQARTRLSTAINMAIGGYDVYVSTRGAVFFSALGGENYEPTDAAYGDQYSIYRIGRLKNTGANVYYVPDSLGVFDESSSDTTAHALVVPRPNVPTQAPFVGFVAVPPMILSSSADAFTKDVAVYSRMAAEVNPLPRYSNQFILIEMINLPAL